VALAFQAAFLGGATAYWSRGLTVALIGLAMVVRPPERSLGRWWNIVLLALLIWSVVPLLPLPWLGLAEPGWREILRDYAPDLPRTISPQPWLAAEGWLSLLAGIAAFYWFSTQRWENGRRGAVVRLAAAAAAAFAGTCLLFRAVHYEPPFWHNDFHFGPFPSRNHTGNLLAVGAILCGGCAVVDWFASKQRGWWFAVGAAICFCSLVANLSRGGMLAAGFGAAAYGGWLAWRRQSGPVLGVTMAALVLTSVALFFFAGRFSERLSQNPFREPEHLFGFRGDVYLDACRMIAAEPVAGVGLDNFEPVFESYRAESDAPVRVIHPESDWLWAGAEMGWPGVLLLGCGLVSLGASARSLLRSARVKPAHAATAALAAFLVHSFIDVPGHLFGTALPALLLAAVLVGNRDSPAPGRGGKLIMRMWGLLVVCAGFWLLAGQGASRRASVALRNATGANGEEAYALAQAAAEAGLTLAPLSWELRFQRGIAQIGLGDFDGAQASFKSARLLQPGRAELAEAEAGFWLPHSLVRAEAAWREALAIDRSPLGGALSDLLAEARQEPALAELAREHALQGPDTLLGYLGVTDVADAAAVIEAWRARDPELARFQPDGLRKVLEHWQQQDPARVAALIREHPAWQDAGWRIVATELAAQKQFEAACSMARKHLIAPGSLSAPPGSPEALRLRVLRTPSDFAAALALSEAEESAGDLAMARFVIRRALEEKDPPGSLIWRAAELASRGGDHEMAWMALRRYGQF
jgi:tetratricopeptide (TPR) repeat protein